MAEQESENTSSLKERTAKGLLWAALNSGFMQLLNAVFGIVLMAVLEPKDYGMTAVLAIYSTIAAQLQDSGFVSALTNKQNPTHRDYNSVFWFNILTSAAIYIVLWFCAPMIAEYNNDERLIWLSRYAFLGFFLASFSIAPRAILFKQLKVREQTICGSVALLVSGIVGIVMALCGFRYWSIATQPIVFVGLVSVLSWHFARWKPSLNVSFQPIREMFSFSCKLLVTNIFNNVNKYALEAILGRYYQKQEIGYYSQANKWNLMGSSVISEMVQRVAQPMFVQMGDDEERLKRAFRKMLCFTSFITFPLMFGLSMVSGEFMALFPDKWQPAVPFLRMLCIGGAFLPLTALYSNFIISRGKSGTYMWNTISQSVLIIANVFAVQYFKLELFGMSGFRLMIFFYVMILAGWLLVWHYFVWKEIRLSFIRAFMDILPYLATSVVVMVATRHLTSMIEDNILLLVSRIMLAVILYILLMLVVDRKTMKEYISFIAKKRH
jgi:lipopolysaccharide exporter